MPSKLATTGSGGRDPGHVCSETALAASAGGGPCARAASGRTSESATSRTEARMAKVTAAGSYPAPFGRIIPGMAAITLLVNGKRHTLDVEPWTPLLYVLRNDLDLAGPRFGCGLGQCGACTVLIGGEAVRSCVRPVSQAANVEITTLEGL